MANEKRVRVNDCLGSLGAALVDGSGTSVTFGAALNNMPTIDTTKHAAITLEPDTANEEIVYLTAYTAGATTGTIVRGQEGSTGIAHLSGVPWVHGPTVRDTASGRVGFANRWAADITVNWNTFTALDTGLDIVLSAYPGDILQAGFAFSVSNGTGNMRVDIATWVSGAAANYFSSATATARSLGLWTMVGSAYWSGSGEAMYMVQSGDLSSGQVTVRLMTRVDSSSKVVYNSTAGDGLQFWAKNLGPQEA